MNESIIAHRYATALFEFTAEKGVDTDVFKDVGNIRPNLPPTSGMMKYLNSPNFKTSEKKQFLKNVFESVVNQETLRFLLFVLDQQRQELLDDILRIFEDIYRRHHNIFKVAITTASQLDNSHQQRIRTAIAGKLGGTVDLTLKIKPEIIGGAILRIDDKLLDTSIRTQLKHLERQLSQ